MTSSIKRAARVAALVAPLAALVALGACVDGYSNTTGLTSNGCSTDVVPALDLVVRDSATQRGIASGVLISGTVNGKQGTYVLNQPLAADSVNIWFGSISGTYSVALHKAGYADVSKTGIVVPPADSLDCHPQTIAVDIAMKTTP